MWSHIEIRYVLVLISSLISVASGCGTQPTGMESETVETNAEELATEDEHPPKKKDPYAHQDHSDHSH